MSIVLGDLSAQNSSSLDFATAIYEYFGGRFPTVKIVEYKNAGDIVTSPSTCGHTIDPWEGMAGGPLTDLSSRFGIVYIHAARLENPSEVCYGANCIG